MNVKGGQAMAKCDVLVEGHIVALDYDKYPKFNEDHWMCLGAMQLKLMPSDWTLTTISWKDKGQDEFRSVNVQLTVGEPVASDRVELPARIRSTINRIIRDTVISLRVKEIHQYECHICSKTIRLLDGGRYAEAHHIQPLGRDHKGPDVAENILCVCPNHHAELDFGVRHLEITTLRIKDGQEVSDNYVSYHNKNLYRGGP